MILICDLDGTLVDSFADIRAGIVYALESLGIEPTEPVLALCRRGVSLEQFYQRASGREPGGDEFTQFVTSYRGWYRQCARNQPFPGVADAFAEIRRRVPGLRCAVATTKRTDIARHVLEQADLARWFDVIRGSDGLPHKPDPAVLHDIASTLGASLPGSIMVGDTDRDVLAARAGGCVAVAVTYGGWSADELAAIEPDHMIDAFADIVPLVDALTPAASRG